MASSAPPAAAGRGISTSQNGTSSSIFVRSTFNLPSQEKDEMRIFDETNTSVAALGLQGTISKPEAGSVVYSGMHDQGLLPIPKEGGPYAQLIGCVQAAKAHSDTYLTEIIQQEKHGKALSEHGQVTKKLKLASK